MARNPAAGAARPLSRLYGLLPPACALALTFLAYVGSLWRPLSSPDTWPLILSSKVESLAGIWRVLSTPLMSGTTFPETVARFYHPLTSLTFTFDALLFDLSAPAYYATNLAIHLLAVLGLYALARNLRLHPWTAAFSAAIFGLHPVAVATVPGIPRRQDLVAGACFLGSMALLARSASRVGPGRNAFMAGSLGLFFLSLGGKEIAYGGIGVVPFVALASLRARSHMLRRVMLTTVGFAAVEAVAFGLRWAVLGGLGGYLGPDTGKPLFVNIVEFTLLPYARLVFWPVRGVFDGTPRELLVLSTASALELGLVAWTMKRHQAWAIGVGITWQASFLAVYVLMRTSLSGYALYLPLAGFALVLGAVGEGSVARARGALRTHLAWRWSSSVVLPVAAAAAVGTAIVAAGIIRSSWLFSSYPEWQEASAASGQFVTLLAGCLSDVGPSGSGRLDGLPHTVDLGTDTSDLLQVSILEPFSLESLIRLQGFEPPIQLYVWSELDIRTPGRPLALTCESRDGHPQITVSLANR